MGKQQSIGPREFSDSSSAVVNQLYNIDTIRVISAEDQDRKSTFWGLHPGPISSKQ